MTSTTLSLPKPDNKYTKLMPEMTEDEFRELKADIRHKGVVQPLIVDEENNMIDGRHRWKAWAELIEEGCDLPMPDIKKHRFESEDAKIEVVISTNVKRRQLTYEQRQQIIVKLRLEYGYTMQKIADMLSVNVGTVSRDLAALPEEDRAALEKIVVVSKAGREFAGGGYAPRMLFVTGESTIAKAQSVARGDASTETRTDALEEAVKKWSVTLGQLWYIPSKNRPGSSHRLYVGSCLASDTYHIVTHNYPKPPSLAKLVVTSPPYNQDLSTFRPTGMQMENDSFVQRMRGAYQDSKPEDEYQAEQVQMFNNMLHFTTPDASFFYNHKNRIRESEVISPLDWVRHKQIDWKLRLEIVWDRASSITLNARMFVPCDERIYWLVKDPQNFYFADTTEIKAYTTVWRFAARNEQDFSAPFPNELPHRCIVACSELGDIVLDPYSGTGTTIAECERLSRVGYGIEIDPRYAAGSLERFAQMGLEPTLAPF